MFTQFFGQYLLNKAYLTAAQLKDGLEYQQSVRLKLGVLAVNAGYMTADEADKVNEAQKKMDKKFGELATQMGYLKEEQVNELLSSQKYGYLLLGQALVDMGHMTLQEFEKAINEYKREYSITDKQFEAMQKENIEEIVNALVEFKDSKNEKALKDYLALFMRNLIRFIDSEASINEVSKQQDFEVKLAAKQDIVGELALSTYIAAEEDAFIKFASKYAEEELNSVDEMAEASVGEFLNLHNGIFLVNMSNAGVELEMTPQEVHSNIKIASGYVARISLGLGEIELIIVE